MPMRSSSRTAIVATSHRFAIVTAIAMSAAVVGCPKKAEQEGDKSAAADGGSHEIVAKKRGADDDAGRKRGRVADRDDASAKIDGTDGNAADEDRPAARPSADGPFTAVIERQAITFKYGKAYAGSSGLHVVLSNEKSPCNYLPPSDDAYQVEIDLSPGPGGKFFAGKPTGVPAYLNSQKLKLKQTYFYPYQVTANVEPFKLRGGEHVRGTLDFDVKWTEMKADTTKRSYTYVGAGRFDVEICDDYNKFRALAAQPDEPIEGPVAGTYGTDKFRARTALAIVFHDANNDADYVDAIELYPTDDVTCTNRWDHWTKSKYFIVRSIGGAGSKHKMLGSPQSADPAFSIPQPASTGKGKVGMSHWFGGANRRAWVRFDTLEFKAGGKIKGVVYADSAPGAKPAETGKIAGAFEAKVCGS